jgi:glycosyltransferase involved in cell wall biosynthesis
VAEKSVAEASFRQLEVLVIGQLPPPVHGSNVMTAELLASLGRLDVRWVFIDKRLSHRIDEVERLSLRKIFRAMGLAGRVGFAAIRHRRIGVCIYLLACTPHAFILDAFLIFLLRVTKMDVVPYLHGIGFRDLGASGWYRRWLVGTTLRASNRVVVLGRAGAIDVAEWVESGRITSIPNTLPDDPIPSAPSRHDSVCRILYISTLSRAKGAMDLIRAAGDVLTSVPDAEFVIAGQSYDPGFDQELRSAAIAANVGGRIRFLGPVYGAEKGDLLASSDVFVLPTRHENQPLVILEAMRAGVPVVSTRVGTIPDQVEQGVNGYLVEPGDVAELSSRLKRLCMAKDERVRMGVEGRRIFSERFSQSLFDGRWHALLIGARGSTDWHVATN